MNDIRSCFPGLFSADAAFAWVNVKAKGRKSPSPDRWEWDQSDGKARKPIYSKTDPNERKGRAPRKADAPGRPTVEQLAERLRQPEPPTAEGLGELSRLLTEDYTRDEVRALAKAMGWSAGARTKPQLVLDVTERARVPPRPPPAPSQPPEQIVKRAVEEAYSRDRFIPPSMDEIHDLIRQTHPDFSVEQFHNLLTDMESQGLVRLHVGGRPGSQKDRSRNLHRYGDEWAFVGGVGKPNVGFSTPTLRDCLPALFRPDATFSGPWDESKHPRGERGRFGLGISSAPPSALGSEAPPAPLPATDPTPTLTALWGPRLSVSDPDHPAVRQHLADLALVPPAAASALASRGVTVHLGASRGVTTLDHNGHLQGVTPRGWEGSGRTWDDVPGAYDRDGRTVSAGSGPHGSPSVLLHEVGHALDHAFGLSGDPEVRELHAARFHLLSPYFRQGGPGGEVGVQETIACAFAHTLKDPARCEKLFGPAIADWVRRKMLTAAVPPSPAPKGFTGAIPLPKRARKATFALKVSSDEALLARFAREAGLEQDAAFGWLKGDPVGNKFRWTATPPDKGTRVQIIEPGTRGKAAPKQPAAPKEKPPAKGKPARPTPEAMSDYIKALTHDSDSQELADRLTAMTVNDLKDLMKLRGLTARGMKTKSPLVQAIRDHAEKLVEAGKQPAEPEPAEPTQEPLKAEELLQDDPGHPVARAIREDVEAAAVVRRMLDWATEQETSGEYGRAVRAKEEVEKAWKEYETARQGPQRHDKLSEWSKLYTAFKDMNGDDVIKGFAEEGRRFFVGLMKPEAPPKLVKVYAEKALGWVDTDSPQAVVKGSGDKSLGYVSFAPTPEQEKAIDESLDFIRSVAEGAELECPVEYSESLDGRAGFIPEEKAVRAGGFLAKMCNVKSLKKGKVQVGVKFSHEDAVRTGVHELGHLIDDFKPGVMARSLEFLDYRLKGEASVDMGTIPGGEDMRGEMVRKDHFDRHFDTVSAYYAGKVYADDDGKPRATEVVSMGLEELHRDPATFIRNDPEYAQFVISVLRMK